MRHPIVLALTLTLGAGAALADNAATDARSARMTTGSPAVDAMLHPSAGRVPFMIRTTQPRRVMGRSATVAGVNEYACTTPCRLYVEPGALDVTLEGWGSHTYRWDVPASGGSVSLLSRSASGALDAMP